MLPAGTSRVRITSTGALQAGVTGPVKGPKKRRRANPKRKAAARPRRRRTTAAQRRNPRKRCAARNGTGQTRRKARRTRRNAPGIVFIPDRKNRSSGRRKVKSYWVFSAASNRAMAGPFTTRRIAGTVLKRLKPSKVKLKIVAS